MVPSRLVVSSHVRQEFTLVKNLEFCLGAPGEGLGQLDCGTAAFLVGSDQGINIDERCEGFGIDGRATQSEIRRIEGEFRGILEDIEAERGVSEIWR